jgi:hypothetical protein
VRLSAAAKETLMFNRLTGRRRYVLIAAALAVLALVPVLSAGALGEASSKTSLERRVSKLSKQVKKLNRKVKALQTAPGTAGPAGATGATGPPGPLNGAAGGDLIGTYPDPLIAPDAIGSAEVANDTLTAFDLAGGESTGAISLPAGYVADGRCRDGTIAVGGATPGDAVIVSINGTVPEGILIYGARVPSANTVTIKVCNLSGSAMAAITNLPIAVVTITI